MSIIYKNIYQVPNISNNCMSQSKNEYLHGLTTVPI